MDKSKIKPGLMVHVKGTAEMRGVPGEHVGTVDHREGKNYIKLTRGDSKDGNHRWVPIDLVAHVNHEAVFLNCTLEEFSRRVFRARPKDIETTEPQPKAA